MRRWRGTPKMLLGAAILTFAASCTAGPSTRPAIIDGGGGSGGAASTHQDTPARPALPPLSPPGAGTINWQNCDGPVRAELGAPAPPASLRLQCGQVLNLPRSPDEAGTITPRISVLKAGNGKIPLLVVNDVGGLPGTLYAARLAGELPQAFLHTFSLIGVDRRGTGSSSGLHCVPQQVRQEILGYDPDSTDLAGLLDAERKATQQCVVDLDNSRQAFDTWQTAGDLDTVRAALGAPRLDAIGHGEGSRVLTVYAHRFPKRMGRIVLDGIPDPSSDPQQRAQQRAHSASDTFDAFAAHCTQQTCPLGAQPRQAVSALLDRLRATPLSATSGTEITQGMALRAMLTALGDPSRWPVLADALARARSGDGNGLADLIAPALGGSSQHASRFDARMVTGCNDDPTRLPPKKVMAAVKDAQAAEPLFGATFAQALLLCSAWPVPSDPLPTTTGEHVPPLLVLSSANDPVTPGPGTQHAAQLLPSAVLVSWEGTGHGAIATSPCATQATQRFLVDGVVPTDGTVCPA
ncbi:MAG: alpha/beta hydrolase [Sciscionella sp.]